MKTLKQISTLIRGENLEGFSVAVKGKLKRYIVAITHNSKGVTQELVDDINEAMYVYDNVTVWGWVDIIGTGKTYIDAWMSTDSYEYAMNVAWYNKQIAIYDTVENKDIIVKEKN